MRLLLISILLVLIFSIPVVASNYYHEMSIIIEGEYKLTTNVAVPEVVQIIDLEGIGTAQIYTKLKKFENASWWDLF